MNLDSWPSRLLLYDTAKPYGPSDASRVMDSSFGADLGSSPET
ncbi:hypothetical protein [Maribacter halichondriae]|nr:hypothetical protein [Maribacter sp. Hal144]